MIKKILMLIVVIIIIGAIVYTTENFTLPNPTDNLKTVKVNLYFSTKDAMYLQAEEREVDSDDLYLNTVKELIKGPKTASLSPTIPRGVEINKINLKGDLAYLDFNQALIDNHWGGSTGEMLTVYSIVNTMTQFSEINRVQILINGEEKETLVGHLYLLEPLDTNLNIIKPETD